MVTFSTRCGSVYVSSLEMSEMEYKIDRRISVVVKRVFDEPVGLSSNPRLCLAVRACLAGRRSQGRQRQRWRLSSGMETQQSPEEEVENVAGENNIWTDLHSLLPLLPSQ